MTAIADPPQPAPSRAPTGGSTKDRNPGGEIAVCPFLRSSDAAWSSTQGSRDLRCWAVRPTGQPALQKQRDLCVVGAHVACAAYAAAVASDPAVAPIELDRSVSLWPAASPVPVALDPVHTRAGVGANVSRSGGQALLIGLMVVAFVVLAIARNGPLGGSGEEPGSSGAPGASAIASAPVAAVATPVPTPAATPSPVAASPSAVASATPGPSASPRTYKVRSGDSVASIALKFHTTVKAIVAANKIVDARTIHPGQVLIVP